MEWLAIGLGLFSAGSGIFAGAKQRRQDRYQAALTYKSNQEEIRRREFQQTQTLGATKAFSEASGVVHEFGSTPTEYLQLMTREFATELRFMREYAEQARRLSISQASLNQQTNVFNSLSRGLQTYGVMKG